MERKQAQFFLRFHDLARASHVRTCCHSPARQLWRLQSRRTASSSSKRQQSYSLPSPMQAVREAHKVRNRTTMNYCLSALIGTITLAYGSVPLYKTICQQTGWGGQPVRHNEYSSSDPGDRLTPVLNANRLRITFSGSTSDVLPWRFVPQQREVRVLPGETALAFYTAKNKSDADIIGVATYSVTPGQVAPYFSKIQCFCFEEQRLNAGEEVDMPVFFYLDPAMLDDPNVRGITEITLNYTFFKAKYDSNGKLTAVPGA